MGWIAGIAGLCVIATFGTCVYVCGATGKVISSIADESKEPASASPVVDPVEQRTSLARELDVELAAAGVRVEATGPEARTLQFTHPSCAYEMLTEINSENQPGAGPKAFGFVRFECHDGNRVVAVLDL